jgi:hypothetical protein
MMAAADLMHLEWMLNRFRKLVGELMRGGLTRNTCEPWEVDIETCQLPPGQQMEMLRQSKGQWRSRWM